MISNRNIWKEKRGTNLLEFLNIDIQLTPQLRFCVGKGRDLVCERSTASCFGVCPPPFYFVFGLQVCDLGVFVSKYCLEVHFSNFGLVR